MVTKKLTPQKASKRAISGRKKPVRKPVRRKKANRKWKVNPWLVAGLVLALVAGVLYPYFKYGKFASEGAAIPDGAHAFCVDLSHHNTGIVWDSLKVVVDRTGHTTKDLLRAKSVFPVSTVILKATEGEKFTDRKFAEYWEEAGKRSYPRGAYHFFRSSRNPDRQAQHYISKVTLRHSDLPPILDVETMHEGCTKQELNDKRIPSRGTSSPLKSQSTIRCGSPATTRKSPSSSPGPCGSSPTRPSCTGRRVMSIYL